ERCTAGWFDEYAVILKKPLASFESFEVRHDRATNIVGLRELEGVCTNGFCSQRRCNAADRAELDAMAGVDRARRRVSPFGFHGEDRKVVEAVSPQTLYDA